MSNQYGPRIVTNGLVLCLDAGNSKSYPGSGTVWYDLSENNRNATINGNPIFSNGYFTVDADSKYFSLLNTGLIPRTNNFTYSCWINFSSFDGADTIFENGSWPDTLLFRYEYNNGIKVFAESSLRGTFNWVATANQWYNIVFLRNNNIASCYINNILTGTPFSMNLDIDLVNTSFWIMRSRHTSNQFTNGKIASFMVYNIALSANEVSQNYNAIKGRFGL